MTKDKQNRFSRRRTLQLLGSAGIAGLAGCGGGGGDGGSTGGSGSDGSDGSSDGGSGDGGSGDGGSSDGLPSRSEAVEEWGPRINEAAREAGIDWEQESGTALTFGMNVHPYTATVEPLLDYFTELTGINVSFQTFPEDQLWQKLTLDLNNETGVYDGFFLGLWPSARYHNANWVADYNQFINDASLTDQDWFAIDDWPESAIAAFTYGDDDLVALPIGVEAYGCIAYDVPTYEELGLEVPTSYPELRDNAKQIHESDIDRAGIVSRASSTTLSSANWATVFKSYDAEWVDYDAKEATLNSQEGVDSLEIFAEMMGDYGPDDIGTFDWYKSNQAMGNGQVGMAIHTPSAIGPWTQEQIDRTEWIPPLPGPNGTQSAATWQWALGISQFTQNPRAAWLFIQWATSREMMMLTNTLRWEGQGVYGPARSNWLFEQDDYIELGPKESWRNAHSEGMSYVPRDPPPVPLHTPQNMDIMTEAAVAMNSAVTDSSSAQQALDDAAPAITEYAKEIPDSYL